MRTLAVVAGLLLAGCITPGEVQQNRRAMSAPVIGCPPADTVIESASPDATVWTATCEDRGRTYDCRGEMIGIGLGLSRFAIICDPQKKG